MDCPSCIDSAVTDHRAMIIVSISRLVAPQLLRSTHLVVSRSAYNVQFHLLTKRLRFAADRQMG